MTNYDKIIDEKTCVFVFHRIASYLENAKYPR